MNNLLFSSIENKLQTCVDDNYYIQFCLNVIIREENRIKSFWAWSPLSGFDLIIDIGLYFAVLLKYTHADDGSHIV